MDQNPPASIPSTSGQRLPTEALTLGNNERCEKCNRLTIKKLVRRRQRGIDHHSSLEALERSADLGCDFCQFIINCLKMTRAKGTKPMEGGVSVGWNDAGYSDWSDTGQSLYAVAKESDKPSYIIFAISREMLGRLPSSGVRTGEISDANEVYETLRVRVGDLPRMQLKLIVSRGDNIYIDENGKYDSQHAGHRVGGYPIDPDLGSPVNLSIAKGWLDDCRHNHAECRPIRSSNLPARVLDVGVSERSHTCRLVETGNQQGNYVALSHCWGGKIKESLTTETLSTFLRSIQIAQLPANFRDAIYVTRQLGMRYLWIDALCILQDSKEDWASESEKMGSIYQDSTLTIFAMTSQGGEEGFIKTANPPYPNSATLKVSSAADNQASVLVTGRDVKEENFETLRHHSALSKRGWAFQEVVLSNQSLFFGARQLYWQCRKGLDSLEGLYPESGSTAHLEVTVPQTDGQPEGSDDRFTKVDFYTLASEYSGKALTYSSDKLPAFSGLAQKFQHVFGGEYLAGLWRNDLDRGLLWFLEIPLLSDSSTQANRLPSWSWASRNEEVFFYMKEPQVFLEFHCSDIRPRDIRNRYGEIKSEGDAFRPSITVIGMTMPLARGNRVLDPHDQMPTMLGYVSFDVLDRLESHVYDSDRLRTPMTIINGSFMLSLLYLEEDEDEDEDEEEGKGEGERKDAIELYPGLQCNYLALAVSGRLSDEGGIVHGLILQESGGAFKRVGFWSSYSGNWSWKGWKTDQMLKLV